MKREASNPPLISSATRLFVLLIVGSAGLLLLGCGSQRYEERLAATAKYFRYRETLNRNLESQFWRSHGIEIRVPKGFILIPGPQPVEKSDDDSDAKGEESEPPVDPRQPSYINGGLPVPGLIGAWQKRVKVEGLDQPVPCDMFLLSNQDLFRIGGGAEAAKQFYNDAPGQILNGLSITKDVQWPKTPIPAENGYVDRKIMRIARLTPQKLINGTNCEVLIYNGQTGKANIVCIVMFVIPSKMVGGDTLYQQIPYCLETLKVKDEVAGAPGAKKVPVNPGF